MSFFSVGMTILLIHLCFFSKELNTFISGDQLLPTISSHVGTFPTEPDANPVEDWIASCHKLINILPEDVLEPLGSELKNNFLSLR